MTLVDYPGHLVVATAAVALAVLTVAAFHSAEARTPQRRRCRRLLMLLQYAVIVLLFVITWDPSTLQTSKVFQRNSVLTLFDTSESMSIADEQKLARLDKAVARFTASFRPDDPTGPEYRLYGFDRHAYHCGSPQSLHRWGCETNVHTAISLLSRHAQDEGGPAAGAVIFTDGRADDRDIRSYVPPLEKGTPLLLVGVGSRTPGADIAIKSISAPARAWIDTMYPVVVAVAGAKWADEPFTLELLYDGQIIDSRQIVRDQSKRAGARPAANETMLEFKVPAQQLGTHVLTARVAPHRNDTNVANNTRSAAVEVTQKQISRVLLYSQQASFDVAKIRQALAWDKRVELDLRLDVIRDPVLSQRASVGLAPGHFPDDREELQDFDVVILGPCEWERFTPVQREVLYRFVADRGGGLVLLPGPAVTSLVVWQDEQADALLPVILDAANPRFQPPGPDAIQLSLEAQITGVFNAAHLTNPGQALSPYYNIARTKPAATTLATVGDAPILSVHRLGRGRLCLLNAAKLFTLYREDQQGGLLGDLICGLIAYLGAVPSAGTGVDLFVERATADPKRAAFVAYVTDRDFQPVSEASVLLTLGNQVMTMEPAGGGRYTAELDVGPAESVVATAQAQSNGTFLGERTIAANLPPIQDEMSETDLDEPFLKALARQIDARYVHVDDIDSQVAQTFAATRQIGTTEKVTSAWPQWPLLLLLCLLLSAKWFLRRSIGLV
ncbi:MAG: VWA domain-containing protein [Sedimentisphaerales bacterium]|nr:VWA domain-containing protein [Sedimentisphaerales bacterium]